MDSYDEKLQQELTYTRFDQMAERYPHNTAIIFLGQRFSYRQLKELSERFGAALMDMGVKKGDKVMVYISNSPQWLIAFLGIQKIGAVLVPVSPIYTSFEIEYMLNDSGAETIVCLDTNFCRPSPLLEEMYWCFV